MFSPSEIVRQLEALGVTITLRGENLIVRPASRIPSELIRELRQQKAKLVDHLRREVLADALDAAAERAAIAEIDGEQPQIEAELLALRSAGKVLKETWESTADLPPAGVAILALMRHQRGCVTCSRVLGSCPEGAEIVERWNRTRSENLDRSRSSWDTRHSRHENRESHIQGDRS